MPVADIAFHIDDCSTPGGRHVETLVETTNAGGKGVGAPTCLIASTAGTRFRRCPDH